MERIRLAIVTREPEYGKALRRGLAAVNRFFEIGLFDGGSAAERLAGDAGPFRDFASGFDLVLWDEDMRQEPPEGVGNVVRLAERGAPGCLCKYQTAGAFQREIFRIYREKTGKIPPPQGRPGGRVIAFFSSRGGTGCSTVCMGVCQELARSMRKRVLYVTLDGLEPTEEFFGGEGPDKGLAEYLYRLFSDPAGRVPFPEEYLIRDDYGVFAFARSGGRNPLAQLTEREMERFLAVQLDEGGFDAVLADLGNCVNDAAPAVMGMADRVCEVLREEAPSQRARQLSFFREAAGGSALQKPLRVRNFCRERTARGRGGLREEHAGGEIRISRKETESPGVMLEGAFGKDIHELTRALW